MIGVSITKIIDIRMIAPYAIPHAFVAVIGRLYSVFLRDAIFPSENRSVPNIARATPTSVSDIILFSLISLSAFGRKMTASPVSPSIPATIVFVEIFSLKNILALIALYIVESENMIAINPDGIYRAELYKSTKFILNRQIACMMIYGWC